MICWDILARESARAEEPSTCQRKEPRRSGASFIPFGVFGQPGDGGSRGGRPARLGQDDFHIVHSQDVTDITSWRSPSAAGKSALVAIQSNAASALPHILCSRSRHRAAS